MIYNYVTTFMLTSVLSKINVNLPMLNLVFVVVQILNNRQQSLHEGIHSTTLEMLKNSRGRICDG